MSVCKLATQVGFAQVFFVSRIVNKEKMTIFMTDKNINC
uniref:Uncharacterized protein n=1 Tax=Anguilla anguilla TaxID=7936 RepID=A0A0E9VUL1_ANGAN